FVTDSQGFCIYSNPRCQEKWGLQPGEPLSSQWERTIHSEDQSRILADWTAYLQGNNGFSAEFRTHTGNENTYWVQMYAAPMFSEQGTPLGHVGTCEDITERKLAEAAQSQIIQEQAARREAEAANRMKDEFLAVLSHELRTPLNSMLGWSRLLRSKKFDEATTARALETIERNAATQAQLIEDILDVSQIIRGKLRLNLCPISLASVVEAAITSMRPTADAKAINLKFEVDGSETEIDHQQWMVYGDPVRLQQVVWNLLSNAIKFTSDGGQVQVRLSHVQGGHPDDYSSFKLQSSDSRCAQVTVTDTGKGISPEFLPYVFDRFRQADSTTTRAHSGLGLGLAIVRHLVELQGGRVQADSPGDDQGATFTIRLPLVNGDRTRATEEIVLPSSHALTSSLLTPSTTETLREHPALLTSRKILIVDDEPDTRDFLAFLLRQYGAIAVVVSSASEALAVFESVRPDLVISDISMPEQDGYSLIQQLRSLESGADIPAIALTANSREHDRDQALAAGFHVYLAKPVQEAELVSAIVQMLERRGVEARG
ncbi:response regulator, partial [Leptolyngbya sp. FACHB-36]|uniref:hybrid sensor histidine kinase/response regulator n=1 Tax=Leptolyngbya sp. FACHB-36 TaxID=2692808 RepID=UPI001681BF98